MEQPGTIDRLRLEIREQIVDRSMPPGSKLSESLLCKKWNVSRTPLREALRQLEAEGLVTSHRNKGFTINPITLEDLNELYPIKIHLEGLAGRLATSPIHEDPAKLRALDELCREMEELLRQGDVDAFIKKNNDFHSFIWYACGNKWLIKILDNLNCQVQRFVIKALHLPHRMEESVREHREICEKLKVGNERAVEKALQTNHRRAFEALKREFK